MIGPGKDRSAYRHFTERTAHTQMDQDSIRPGNVATLAATLDLARQFAGEVSGVPVEIVEAGEQAEVLGDSGHSEGHGVATHEEALDIMDVTGTPDGLATTLTVPVVPPSTMASGMAQVGPLLTSSADVVQQLAAEGIVAATHTPSDHTGSVKHSVTSLSANEVITSTADLAARLGVSLDPSTLEHQLQHVSQTAMQTFQEFSRTLNVLESAINQPSRGLSVGMGMSYSDLTDMTRVINSSVDPNLTVSSSIHEPGRTSIGQMESVLNEREIIPSSPDSNFDTNELLNTVSHRDEVMSKLASTGPVGELSRDVIQVTTKVPQNTYLVRAKHCQYKRYL